jgi:hypothetical protein
LRASAAAAVAAAQHLSSRTAASRIDLFSNGGGGPARRAMACTHLPDQFVAFDLPDRVSMLARALDE